MTAHVYFLRAEDTGAIKIGTTTRLKARLSSIRTASAQPITFLGSVAGGASFERLLHSEFASTRLRGEWFEPSNALLERIASLLASGDKLEETPTPTLDDAHTQTAINWIISIENGEAERRGCRVQVVRKDLAKRIGVPPGYIESLRRGRKNHPIYARDFEAIKTAYIAELNQQLYEAQALLAMASGDVRAAAETQLVAAREILAGDMT